MVINKLNRLPKIAIFALGLVSMLGATRAMADSFWQHNGSLMRLQANGNQRVISYEQPSARMWGAGVRPGTVLFDGIRQGNQYYGQARVFSKDCPTALRYRVQGVVQQESTIVLTGNRLSFGAGCQPNGRVRTDTLVFTLLR